MRRDDIPELTRHFLTRIAAEEGKRISQHQRRQPVASCRLSRPGNVRQLENAIFRAVVLADGDEIGANEFPQIAALLSCGVESVPPLIEPSPAMAASWPDADSGTGQAPARVHSLSLTDPRGDVRPLEDIERDAIRFALSHYRGQMSEVARRLKSGRSTLYRKLEGLGRG